MQIKGTTVQSLMEATGGEYSVREIRNLVNLLARKKNVGECHKNPLVSSKVGITTILTASSQNLSHQDASHGVFSSTKSIWCPNSNTNQEWIQVDLGEIYFVCGVAAVNDFGTNRTGVTWYRVFSFVTLPGNFTQITENSPEFVTNIDVHDVKIHSFQRIARYIRFLPTRFRGWPCMKVEVYGKKKVPKLRMSIPVRNKTVDTATVTSTSLRCLATGYPSPNYIWFKDGKKLIPNGRLSERNSVLYLTRLHQRNSGWYTCHVRNALGDLNSTAYLMVIRKDSPKVRGLPDKKVLIQYNSSTLTCELQTKLTSTVSWYKDGKTVETNRRVIMEYSKGVDVQFTSLHIKNTFYGDSGNYTCVFNNTVDVFSKSARIDVHALPFILRGLYKKTKSLLLRNLALGCTAEGRPTPAVYWFKNGQSFGTDKELVTSKTEDGIIHSTLRIASAAYNDSAVYMCRFNNTHGDVSSSGTVIIEGAPEFIKRPTGNQSVKEGDTIILECKAFGVPAATIRWKLNGKQVVNPSFNKNGTLVIRNAKNNVSFEGLYECEASNYLGRIAAFTRISIYSLPMIKSSFESHQLKNEGQTIFLRCTATGDPKPQLLWSKDGFPLEQTPRVYLVDDGQTLVIRKLERSDSGAYLCLAKNKFGNSTAIRDLIIFAHPFITTPHETNMRMVEGSSLVLRCSASGNPSPTLEWWRDGLPLYQTKRTYFQDNKEIMKILNLTTKDSGLYVCSASNKIGTVVSKTNVGVYGKPVINTNLTKREVQGYVGNATSIKCIVSNSLPVRYKWTKNLNFIHNSDNIRMYNNSLVVTPLTLDDFGVYVCHVTNIAGYANYSIRLIQAPGLDDTSARVAARSILGLILAIVIPVAVVIIVPLAVVVVYFSRRNSHS